MSKSILIIDDEIEILNMLGSWFEENNYQVMKASNGKDGLDFLKQKIPNIVLLDIIMPKMTGFQVLSEIKRDPRTSLVPVIMLTAMGDTSAIFETQRMRATDYVIKPFDLDALLRLIKKYES